MAAIRTSDVLIASTAWSWGTELLAGGDGIRESSTPRVDGMFRRWVTWVLCLAAMVAGSVAWAGWVYLNTWADPATTTRVTNAVLDDPGARDEVLAPVRGQVMAAIPAEFGISQEQVDAALVAVLTDPSARARIAEAFVSEAGALNFDAASAAFQREFARSQPQLAPIIEETPTDLSLPDVSTSSSLRNTADDWVWRLAAVSALLFLASFVIGDPRLTARRFGYWAVATGFLWVVGSPIATWLAPRISTSVDATATVVVREYTAPIGPWALALTIAGLVAIAGSFLVPRRRDASGRRPVPEPARREPRRERRRGAAAVVTTVGPQYGQAPPPRRDTALVPPAEQVPTDPTEPIPTAKAGDTRTMPIQANPTRDHEPRPPVESGDVDVWAAYDTPAPPSDV